MAKGEAQQVKPADVQGWADVQAKYNRGNVSAGGMGSRTTTPTGDTTFQFDPNLTNTDALTQAMYNKSMSLMNPQWEQQQRTLEQSLANRGLPSTGEAYGTEMGNFYRGRNTAMENAANQAVLSGEQARQGRLAQAMQLLGYSPTPVDVMGPAGIVQSGYNQTAQNQANAKGGATGLAGSLGSMAMMA